jgi:hypothetical protein
MTDPFIKRRQFSQSSMRLLPKSASQRLARFSRLTPAGKNPGRIKNYNEGLAAAVWASGGRPISANNMPPSSADRNGIIAYPSQTPRQLFQVVVLLRYIVVWKPYPVIPEHSLP